MKQGSKKIPKKIPLSKIHRKLWKLCSEYNRRKFADRNGYVSCCTCGRIAHWKEMDAGHWLAKGAFPNLKYEDFHINAQCGRCNMQQGMPLEYREFLVSKYGEQKVKDFENKRKIAAGYTRDGLLLRIEEYKEKLKGLIWSNI